jgi:xylulokinase
LEKSRIDPRNIAAVGLTGQMHGATLLDVRGDPLRPCILWNDQRTQKQCNEITARVGAERVLQLTGNPGNRYVTGTSFLSSKARVGNLSCVKKLAMGKAFKS